MYENIVVARNTLDDNGYEGFEGICPDDNELLSQRVNAADGAEEAFILRTCQRCELYASGPGVGKRLTSIADSLGIDTESTDTRLAGKPAVEHLFRVACGLESGVLGEDEILGQLRDAYIDANEAGTLGDRLDTIVLKALRAGERARSETAINEGATSLGSIAVEQVRDRLEESGQSLAQAQAVIVGAGEVAQLVVKALGHRNVGQVTVANRTKASACELAADVDGEALALAELTNEHFAAADVLVTATGASHRLFSREDFSAHDLVVIDLANPRDVDPDVNDLETIDVVNIQDVFSARDKGIERRKNAVPAVESIIETELEELRRQLRAERVDDALDQIYSQSHDLRQTEFQRALERLSAEGEQLSETQRAVMEDFSEALINKLLHPKTAALRQAAATDDRETLEAWLTLFDQNADNEESAAADPPASTNR